VTVVVPHAAGVAGEWEDGGVEVRSFRYAPERWEVLGYGRSLEADEGVKRGAGVVAPLYGVAAWRAVRGLVRERRFDVVQGHWVVPNGVVTAALGRGAGRPRVAVGLHGSDVFLAERPGVRAAVRWALGRTDVVTGCSPELVERVCRIGFPRERAHVIPYGVDVESFRPVEEAGEAGRAGAAAARRRLGVPEGVSLALSVGRMATKKGFDVLLAALPGLLAEAPEAHWVLAGSGDRLEAWRRQAAAMEGGERVHFPGAVLRDALPDLYRAADVFVLPAVHDAKGNVDGLPNVILEAMASGLPVVASGISGIPLAVADGETGTLVPERDPRALAAALAALLADPDRRRALGRAGRRRAVTELTWDAVARRYRDAYRAP
jgi:glycosyltransferase involved in cell wall biosynthesis